MKIAMALGICMLLILPVVIGQPGGSGGSTRALTPEELYEVSNNFTKCLIYYCDYFCKQHGLDTGYYYEEGKCWCDSYTETAHGDVKSNDGWIEIDKCSQEEVYVKSNQNLSYTENLERQNQVLWFTITLLIFTIVVLSIVIFVSRYNIKR